MRFKNILYLVVLGFWGCQKSDQNFDTIKIVGHAVTGLGVNHQVFPENSQSAISYAFAFPDLDGIEIDIQRSIDGTWWLFHDESLNPRTNASGIIQEKQDSEIENIRYGGFNGESLVRLKEVDFSTSIKKVVFIEPKFLTKSIGFEFAEIIELNQFLLDNWGNYIEVHWILNFQEYAESASDAGLSIYCDLFTLSSAETLIDDFSYQGFFIKNGNFSAQDVKHLQNLAAEVIIFDMKSPLGVRSALEKQPDMILPGDFKVAIIEKFK
jgi:glycerophosphoryl diester phosphodiesterase